MPTLVRVCLPLVFVLAALRPAPAAGGPSEASPPFTLPPNIQVGAFLREPVEALLRASETFRRQCARIGGTRLVRVVVVSGTGAPLQSGARARARINRHGLGLLFAVIELPLLADFQELLPHELEHVIEQIEGRDLAALARSGEGGVVELAGGMFETERARAAGLAAAREALGFADAGAGLKSATRTLGLAWRGLAARASRAGTRGPVRVALR